MPEITNDQNEDVQENEQSENGQKQEEVDFQSYIDKLGSTVDEKLNKALGNWSNDVGDMRKAVESVNEKFAFFEEKFKSDDDETDLYDQKVLSEFISKRTNEAQKPLLDKLEEMTKSYVTTDFLDNWMKLSQTVTVLKQDFKLTDAEVTDLNNESQKTGENIELLAFRKFGNRKFTDKNKQLVDELKNKDSEPPVESGQNERFKKTKTIPDKFDDFHRMHKEKGTSEMRRMIKEAAIKGD